MYKISSKNKISLKLIALILILFSLDNCLITRVFADLIELEWHLSPRLSGGDLSPDCYAKRMMFLVNNQNPGPTIEATVGDTIRITFINHHPSESVSIHYHGLHLKNNLYNDGASTVAQCATGPHQTHVHEFVAFNAGTHLWHGHVSMNRVDGLQGAIVIHDIREEQYNYDEERILFIQDWFHTPGPMQRVGLDTEPFVWIGNPESMLINGKGLYKECEASDNTTEAKPHCTSNSCTLENSLSSLFIEPGKTYRLRIINGGSLLGINFAIAHHNLTLIEVEGTTPQPIVVSNWDVLIGQRFSFLLTSKSEAELAATSQQRFWISVSPRYRDVPRLMGYAFLDYNISDSSDSSMNNVSNNATSINNSSPSHPAWDNEEYGHFQESLLVTDNPEFYEEYTVLQKQEISRRIVLLGTQNRRHSDNQLRWAMNNISLAFSSVPLITKAYRAATKYKSLQWPNVKIPGTVDIPEKIPFQFNYTDLVPEEVVHTGESQVGIIKLTMNDIIEVVLQNARALNGVAEMHTWHTHGHSFWVVGSGYGNFDDENDPQNYNLQNPIRRDTLTLLPNSWTAIRFQANNPGVWMFHCALQSHLVMGMGINFITSPQLLPPPPDSAVSCFLTSAKSDEDEDHVLYERYVQIDGDSEASFALKKLFSHFLP